MKAVFLASALHVAVSGTDLTTDQLGSLLGSLLQAAARMTAEHQAGVEKAAALVTSVFLHGTLNPAGTAPHARDRTGRRRSARNTARDPPGGAPEQSPVFRKTRETNHAPSSFRSAPSGARNVAWAASVRLRPSRRHAAARGTAGVARRHASVRAHVFDFSERTVAFPPPDRGSGMSRAVREPGEGSAARRGSGSWVRPGQRGYLAFAVCERLTPSRHDASRNRHLAVAR